MLKPFDSSRLLISRAKKHLDDFNSIESGFVSDKPYRTFSENDPETGEELLKIAVGKAPEDLSPIAFDIVNCLRSTLDHAVFDSARAIGGKPKPKFTKFPFGKTQAQAKSNLDRYKDSEVPKAIRPFLIAFEPYEGGKHALWELNEIRNGKIHRILQSIALVGQGVGTGNGHIGYASFNPVSEWDDVKGELTFCRVGPGAKYNTKMHPTIQVIFDDVPRFSGQPAAKILRKFTEITQRIFLGIEAETDRLKKIAS